MPSVGASESLKDAALSTIRFYGYAHSVGLECNCAIVNWGRTTIARYPWKDTLNRPLKGNLCMLGTPR
jgi:hypothetical protein